MELTVQSTGNKSYRLGVSLNDSVNIFKKRHIYVILEIEHLTLKIKTTCGPPLNKGFDFYSKELSEWIKSKKFHNYPRGKPTRLKFEHKLHNGQHLLIFSYKAI